MRKENITEFILTCILIAYGWIIGYIVGISVGDRKATDRHSDLLDEYFSFRDSLKKGSEE